MKRTLSLILAVIMVMLSIPMTAVEVMANIDHSEVTNGSKNVFRFATNKDSYAPGDTVTIVAYADSLWGDQSIITDDLDLGMITGAFGPALFTVAVVFDNTKFTAKKPVMCTDSTLGNAEYMQCQAPTANVLNKSGIGTMMITASQTVNDDEDGYITFYGSGEVCTFTFTVNEDTPSGDYLFYFGDYMAGTQAQHHEIVGGKYVRYNAAVDPYGDKIDRALSDYGDPVVIHVDEGGGDTPSTPPTPVDPMAFNFAADNANALVAGDTVNFNLSVSNNTGLSADDMMSSFAFDNTQLKLIAVSTPVAGFSIEALNLDAINAAGSFEDLGKKSEFSCFFQGDGTYTENGVFLTLTFKVLATAESGTITVIGNSEGTNINFADATVTVAGNHTHAFEDVIVPATCTTIGTTDRVCSCGLSYRVATEPSKGHTPSTKADDITTIPPSCTDRGYTATKCVNCDATASIVYTASLGHDWKESDVAVSCTQVGYHLKACNRCGTEEKTDIVPAPGHDTVLHDGLEPTCTESGYKAYETCTRCDYTSFEEIPALGHDIHDKDATTLIFSDDFTTGFADRNWIKAAFQWDKEKQCIYGYSDALVLQTYFLPPYNKMWDKFYASFDVQVNSTYNTSNDNSVALWYKDQMNVGNGVPDITYMYYIDILTGDAYLTKSVTFTYKDVNGVTQEGTIDTTIASSNIGEKIEVGENAKWFNMGMRVSEGKIECYYNKKLIISVEAKETDEKLGGYALHSVDASVGSVPSAILFWNFDNCISLDNFEVRRADYFDHDILHHEGKAPTCEDIGYEPYEVCSICNITTCSRCGYSAYKEIPALGHDTVLHEGFEPTCTEYGYESYETCTRCDHSTYEEIPALGHRNTNVIGYVAPTCTANGFTGSTFCRDCKTTIESSKTIPAIGHQNKEIINYRENTCTDDGYTGDTYCYDCESTLEYGEVTPATGHQNTEIFGYVAPTCTETGYTGAVYCIDCNTTIQDGEIIPAGHQNTEIFGYVAPTCTETGYTGVVYCIDCGTTIQNGEIIPAAHQYEDGACIHCGEPEFTEPEVPSVLPGDANGDGSVDAADLQLLQRYIAGLSAEMDEIAADANGDGNIDAADTMIISRTIAGLSV